MEYFTVNRSNHDLYAFKFFFCELLNFVNVVGQIYFMDFFLGGEFTKYGTEVLAMTELDPDTREDPMARVFPKVIGSISVQTAVLPGGLDQHLFYLYFPLKQAHRVFLLSTNTYVSLKDESLHITSFSQ